MSRNGIYAPYPVYYVQELKRAGRRDKAIAFMDYWDDYSSEKRGFGEVMTVRYYAKAWHNSYKSRGKTKLGLSPDTASLWIKEFKDVIGKFEAIHIMFENANIEAVNNSVQKSIGQQSDINRTVNGTSKAHNIGVSSNQSDTNTDINRSSIGQNIKKKKEEIGKSATSSLAELKFSEEDYALANILYNHIKLINPNAKKPNLNNWAESCRLMRERDNRSPEHIETLIKFIFTNSGIYSKWDGTFWQSNILSMKKLKAKYDTIYMQIKAKLKRSA